MDASVAVTLLVGFALGLKHSTEADHVVAVSTLVSDAGGSGNSARRSALVVGALWGLGHLLMLFAAGAVLITLRVRMPLQVEWALELMVAVVLLWLGVHTIRKCFAGRYHFHLHRHGAHAHAHLHFHSRSEAGHEHASHAGAAAARGVRRAPLLVGMAHGLAGTAGLALLVLSSIPSRSLGMVYLLVFGLGALLGMAAFGALLGMPLARAKSRLAWLDAIRLAAGAASSVLGAVLTRRAFLPQSWPF